MHSIPENTSQSHEPECIPEQIPWIEKTLNSLSKKTKMLCIAALLSTGCQIPEIRLISANDAVQEFIIAEGNNELLANNPTQEEINQPQIAAFVAASSESRRQIPQLFREYHVTDTYFQYPAITAERLGTHVLLRENKRELLSQMGAARFLGNAHEDAGIFSSEEKRIFQEKMHKLTTETERRFTPATNLSITDKIQYILSETEKRHPSFLDQNAPENENVILRPNYWGLRIEINRMTLEEDLRKSLSELDEESLNTVFFFSIMEQVLTDRNISLALGNTDLRNIIYEDHPRFDCNNIATLRSCIAIDCKRSENMTFHQGLSQVEEQNFGHAFLSIKLRKNDGETWNWILSSNFTFPSQNFCKLLEAEHQITYKNKGVSDDVQILLSGLIEDAYRNFSTFKITPSIHFWSGRTVSTFVSSRQAALAGDLLTNGCITGVEKESMASIASLLVPIILCDRTWGPQIHRLAPEACEQVQNVCFRLSFIDLYDPDKTDEDKED